MKLGLRRSALSFSSWFCLPEQGMKDFEILNRASAFLVRASGSGNRARSKVTGREFVDRAPFPAPKVHLVTSSHVVAPWRWPKYYADEWLQQVNERHTMYTAEMRHADGVFATQSELKPISYHHPTRDLAALHFENEEEVLALLDEVGVDILQLSPAEAGPLVPGDALEFHGHDVQGAASEDVDARTSLPRISSGTVQGRTAHQIFAKTAPVLCQGMCGGPVLHRQAAGEGPRCVGLVEGIVPSDHASPELQSLAVFVESREIRAFLADVEDGLVVPLIGGHSVAAVNADQDEDKMSLEKILSGEGDAPPLARGSNFPSNFPSSK